MPARFVTGEHPSPLPAAHYRWASGGVSWRRLGGGKPPSKALKSPAGALPQSTGGEAPGAARDWNFIMCREKSVAHN